MLSEWFWKPVVVYYYIDVIVVFVLSVTVETL